MKLLQVDTVEEAKYKMDFHFTDFKLKEEEVTIMKGLGRILANDIYSPIDLPEYNRSTVDGYAVLTRDTFGASESLPVFLDLQGMVDMGKATELIAKAGGAVYVPTGGMIPQGADGVVMIEYVEQLDSQTIAVHRPVAPGDGIIQQGEDLKKGAKILSKSRKIKPQDIGALAAVGINGIKVLEEPRVAIISTGDEIVKPTAEITFGKVRDINTYALASLVLEVGGVVTYQAVVKDDFGLLQSTMESLLENNHIVIISGGSSVGTKDVTEKVVDSMGEPGVFVHGVAVKPGKPTIIGKIGNTAVFGLPGHPVSAMIVFKIFVEYLITKLTGEEPTKAIGIPALADSNIHSAPGKETYQMVVLEENGEDYIAKPIYGKSGAISSMIKAQGYVRISTNKEGVRKGEKVKVILL